MGRGAEKLPPNIFLGMCTASECKAKVKELLSEPGVYLLVLGQNYAKIKSWLEADMADKLIIGKDRGYGIEITVQ